MPISKCLYAILSRSFNYFSPYLFKKISEGAKKSLCFSDQFWDDFSIKVGRILQKSAALQNLDLINYVESHQYLMIFIEFVNLDWNDKITTIIFLARNRIDPIDAACSLPGARHAAPTAPLTGCASG
jgi:hypothetical protein